MMIQRERGVKQRELQRTLELAWPVHDALQSRWASGLEASLGIQCVVTINRRETSRKTRTSHPGIPAAPVRP